MNFCCFLLSAFGISLFVAVLADDYCFEDLCINDDPHIACDYTGEFASNCPRDATLIDMDPYIDQILDDLNSKRNMLAQGKIPGFPSAARMASMTWDDELAELAAMNVQRCKMATDCHHTETYQYSGQNVQEQTSLRPAITYKQVTRALQNWWDNHEICTVDDIELFPKGANGDIGQFTCLAADKNFAVGCAIATYSSKRNVFLFTCNFAHCNVEEKPIYITGRTASDCTTGTHHKFHALCSEDEEYEINSFEYD